MLRVAHFSDLHYSGKTLTEVDRCFSFAVDQAIARGLDCAVISGDSTDHALEVHAPAVAALARNIRRLADHCPVLMLHGTFSHEPPGALNVFRLLGGRYRVHVADRLQQVAQQSPTATEGAGAGVQQTSDATGAPTIANERASRSGAAAGQGVAPRPQRSGPPKRRPPSASS